MQFVVAVYCFPASPDMGVLDQTMYLVISNDIGMEDSMGSSAEAALDEWKRSAEQVQWTNGNVELEQQRLDELKTQRLDDLEEAWKHMGLTFDLVEFRTLCIDSKLRID